MRHKILFLFGLSLTTAIAAHATTRKVPQDYATIQAAINAAVNGDTVLVAEGTYFVNLKIPKKIVLGSLYLLDQDTSHISRTILDGSTPSNPDSGTVITITSGSDTTTCVIGFTIRGGTGTKYLYGATSGRFAGGINLASGGASIKNNVITGNHITHAGYVWGGGISAGPFPEGTPTFNWIIVHNSIASNTVTCTATSGDIGSEGAGAILWSNGRFTDNIVADNVSVSPSRGCGGGVSIGGTAGYVEHVIEFSDNLLLRNRASHWGGGIISYIDPSLQSIPKVALTNNILSANTVSGGSGTRVGAAMHAQGGDLYVCEQHDR